MKELEGKNLYQFKSQISRLSPFLWLFTWLLVTVITYRFFTVCSMSVMCFIVGRNSHLITIQGYKLT